MGLLSHIRKMIDRIREYRSGPSINFDPPSPQIPYEPKYPYRPGDAVYKEDK